MAACTVTRLRVKVQLQLLGLIIWLGSGPALGQQESMLWNSQEPMAGEAGVQVSVGPQLRQQVLGQNGPKVPGSV